MLVLRELLLAVGFGMILAALGILLYDVYQELLYRRAKAAPEGEVIVPPRPQIRWRTSLALALLAWGPLLVGFAIVVVPSGMAGVRVSQTSGTVPGTLYPGVHMVLPLIEDVTLFDTRDQIFTTGAPEDGKAASAPTTIRTQLMDVQAKEGLTLGLAITVRYRLDPKKLDYIQGNLPRPVEKEIVPPTVASVWRELVPNYTVRDVFSAKREEVRQRAAGMITQKLAADGIVVKEVMLRDIQLPQEYAKGLETLLLKEQENDQMGVETDLKQKQVRIAELEAEANKVQQIKQAEGEAQVHVLQAKGEADAMQYTLPLKQKQIEQSRLEAQARKEATIQNAEAEAQAKLIDSKAEGERRKVLADAEAQAKEVDSKAEGERRKVLAEAEAARIRVTAAADAERMQSEAAILKQNPLLINKIVAERLSDKLQIMMVPSDGKFFFANDVLRSMNMANQSAEAEQQR
jgi:regulator of protease activity HflC (stomatin/prohibitin superfamily)